MVKHRRARKAARYTLTWLALTCSAAACGARSGLLFDESGASGNNPIAGAPPVQGAGGAPAQGGTPSVAGAPVQGGAAGVAGAPAPGGASQGGAPAQGGAGASSNGGNAGAPGALHAVAVEAGLNETSCAVLSDGSMRCWGHGFYGQLGNGQTEDALAPVPVVGLSDAIASSVGGYHSCAVRKSGEVQCWGTGTANTLGGSKFSAVPLTIPGVSGAIAVESGMYHSCALTRAGLVQCWGENTGGELGVTPTPPGVGGGPLEVPGVSGAVSIAAGLYHTCAVLKDGTMRCWGRNDSGCLGGGIADPALFGPLVVTQLPPIGGASAGNGLTCARTIGTADIARGVFCWGAAPAGGLGDGTLSSKYPVSVRGLNGVVAISTGVSHTCAVLDTGAVQCWGLNGSGELGDGTRVDRSFPITINGLNDITAISAGSTHTCALSKLGAVWCWGFNAAGALGDGTSITRFTPVRVIGF